ncbi:hypothetical protein N7493_001303 [Penicillium malachiteum]|uniref:WD40 repeat-like protein n=1 Tax=Penicillium malachiteum TaxID=1324776 RepID=A0AAD6HUC5_9EURO|nr:hypothetical protein N7493_001303 [Penicillium malachiteum]
MATVDSEESWSPISQTLLYQNYEQKYKEIEDLAFSPDGNFVASSSVCVWDIMTGTLLRTFESLGYGETVSFSPSGDCVISISSRGDLRVWNIRSGLWEYEARAEEDYYSDVQRFYNNGTLAVMKLKFPRVRLVDIAAKKILLTFEPHSKDITDMAVSHDGKLLATSSLDQTVRLWSVKSGKLQKELRCDDGVHCVKFSVDSSQVVSISRGKNFKVWLTSSGSRLHTIDGNFSDGKFTSDGKLFITSTQRSDPAISDSPESIVIWDGKSYESLRTLPAPFEKLQVSQDGKFLTKIPHDPRIRLIMNPIPPVRSLEIWNISTGESHSTIHNDSSAIVKASFSMDGTLIGRACQDGTVRLWDIEAFTQEYATVETKLGITEVAVRLTYRPSDIAAIGFSQSETLLAVGFNHREHLWGYSDDEESSLIDQGHTHVEKSADSDDENWDCILSVPELTLDSHVQIWNLNIREKLPVINVRLKDICVVLLSANGAFVALLVSPFSREYRRIRELHNEK